MGRITRDALVRDLTLARELIERLLVATKRGALDPCDCGHASIEHAVIRDHTSPACLFQPCLVAGCDCIDFDDYNQQITELRRKHRMAREEGERDIERRRVA